MKITEPKSALAVYHLQTELLQAEVTKAHEAVGKASEARNEPHRAFGRAMQNGQHSGNIQRLQASVDAAESIHAQRVAELESALERLHELTPPAVTQQDVDGCAAWLEAFDSEEDKIHRALSVAMLSDTKETALALSIARAGHALGEVTQTDLTKAIKAHSDAETAQQAIVPLRERLEAIRLQRDKARDIQHKVQAAFRIVGEADLIERLKAAINESNLGAVMAEAAKIAPFAKLHIELEGIHGTLKMTI